ncbi:MAG: hypothetical protein ACYC67_25325 [Prosthecobacter sp.]
MKTLISFVSGALTGALLLWFGFRQEVMVGRNGRLVRVDRFTGQASYVFVSEREELELQRAENETLEREEKARKAAAEEKLKLPPAADAKTATPDWRELTAEEIPRLEFKWRANGGSSSVVLSFHNPFEKKVRINRVHVQIPARDGRAAVDRMYELVNFDCGPLADRLTVLDTQDIDWHGIEQAKPGAGAVSGADPFGVPPPAAGANARPRVAGSVTPVQVMMFP